MFLNYFALGVLIFVFLVIFYGIIIIHDIPYLIAKNATTLIRCYSCRRMGQSFYSPRHLAVFMDLGTLYQPERGWGMQHKANTAPDEPEKDRYTTASPTTERP